MLNCKKLLGLLVATLLFSTLGCTNNDTFEGNRITQKEVKSVEYSKTIHVNYPSDEAIKLFTAEGEAYWILGWSPVFVKGNGFNKDDAFLLEGFLIDTVFVVNEYSESRGVISYTRINEGLDVATIDIKVKATAQQNSDVTVTYKITSMGFFGDQKTKMLTREKFESEMESWQSNIQTQKESIDKWLGSLKK